MTNDALLPCPFCDISAIETVDGFAVHHRANCFMRIFGSTYFSHGQVPLWNTRAALAPVDVEGLKLDETNNENLLCAGQDWAVGRIKGWNDCIDHLAARGCFVPEGWQLVPSTPLFKPYSADWEVVIKHDGTVEHRRKAKNAAPKKEGAE